MANKDCDVSSRGHEVIADLAGKRLIIDGVSFPLSWQGVDLRPIFPSCEWVDNALTVGFAALDDYVYKWRNGTLVAQLGRTSGIRNILVTTLGTYWVDRDALHYWVEGDPDRKSIPVGLTSQGISYQQPDGTLIWYDWLSVHKPVHKGIVFADAYEHGEWMFGAKGNNEIVAYSYTQDKVYSVGLSGTVGPRGRTLPDGSAKVAVNRIGEFRTSADFTEIVTPAPVPVPPPVKACYPRKLFYSPYETHSERYGITPEFIGNVSFPDAVVDAPGPFIQDVATYRMDRDNQTLAVYVHAPDLNPKPAEYDAALGFGKPVILYVDGRLWPMGKPTWIDSSRTFLGIQCYRRVGESIDTFRTAIKGMMDLLKPWDLPFMLTVQAYDANGTLTPAEVIETYDVVDELIENYRVVGVQPFADMRPGGMNTYPELRDAIRAQFRRVPGRPNRFDYWAIDDDSLKRKLDYDVPYFTEGERQRLKDALDS